MERRYNNLIDSSFAFKKNLDSKLPCFTGTTAKPSALASNFQPDHDLIEDASGAAVPTASASSTSISQQTSASSQQSAPVSAAFKDRFHLFQPESQLSETIDRLIDSSCNSIFTKLYDNFQFYAQGVY